MRLPTPLSRNNPTAHKGNFGHVLIFAGSRDMLGAAALTGLAAMRTGAGLVTLAVPKSLNDVVQKKISPVIMTFPVSETKSQTISSSALTAVKKALPKYDALAIGPGLSRHKSTQEFICKLIAVNDKPIIIDADALNAIADKREVLVKKKCPKVLTPHPGEMVRLTMFAKDHIEKNKLKVAKDFAKNYDCTLILKGHKTVVAASEGETYINKTGNAGLATAGSGDVLTGMIVALLGQGLSGFEAAKFAVYLHGRAGDLATKAKTKASMIATDIIDQIPTALSSG